MSRGEPRGGSGLTLKAAVECDALRPVARRPRASNCWHLDGAGVSPGRVSFAFPSLRREQPRGQPARFVPAAAGPTRVSGFGR